MNSELPLSDPDTLAQLTRDVGEEAMPVLMAAFDKELSSSADVIHDSFQRRDLALLETTAHALKSATASFGALRLSEVCKAIEFAARDGVDQSSLPPLLRQMDDLILETRMAYGL